MYLVDVSMFSPDSNMLKSLPKLSRQELEVDFSNIIGSPRTPPHICVLVAPIAQPHLCA